MRLLGSKIKLHNAPHRHTTTAFFNCAEFNNAFFLAKSSQRLGNLSPASIRQNRRKKNAEREPEPDVTRPRGGSFIPSRNLDASEQRSQFTIGRRNRRNTLRRNQKTKTIRQHRYKHSGRSVSGTLGTNVSHYPTAMVKLS